MSVHAFVAEFLRSNGYTKTLEAFQTEYGHVISAETPNNEALADIVADRLKYLAVHDAEPKPSPVALKSWTPETTQSREIGPVNDFVVDCAVLRHYALLSTSTKKVVVVDLDSNTVVQVLTKVVGNVVVRRILVKDELVFLCSMTGELTIGEFAKDMEWRTLTTSQIHKRLVMDMDVVKMRERLVVVSVGWDLLVKLFEYVDGCLVPIQTPYQLQSQASCMATHVCDDKLYVVVGRKDHTLLDVLVMRFPTGQDPQGLTLSHRLALNAAEFTAAGFTPTCLRILDASKSSLDADTPSTPLIAVATLHEPFMRVVIVRLVEGDEIQRDQIVTNVNTMSPQDKYSNALIEWRKDGLGLWVFGDDGTVRGLDLSTGQVVAQYPGHSGRIQSYVYGDRLITCGADRKIMLWQ